MTRRHLLMASLVAGCAMAEDDASVLEIFEPLASALSNGDVASFMKPFDRSMPNRGKLRENVAALIARYGITSSIELVRVEAGTVELDWYLELRDKEAAGVSERRRQTVTARVEKKHILSIEPVEFFAPKA